METLSPSLRHTLALLCDALLPIDASLWRASASQRVERLLISLPNEDDVAQLCRLLSLMEVPGINIPLGRQIPPLSRMQRAQREAYLAAMARHPAAPVRAGFSALKRLAGLAYYADVDEGGCNPVWEPMGYPGPIVHPPAVPKPIRPLSVERDLTLDCDVVVVGSGAGGGMVADELSADGKSVVVLEAGEYCNEADFDGLELPMLRRLYLDGGLSATKDGAMTVLAGSCLGGGTVVNYTTSFRIPDAVREEWNRVSGFDFFTGSEFTRSLDAACERLHVNLEHNEPSSRDAIMARGLRACGWHVAAMPRNVQGCTQDDVCGYCGLGCVRGAKCNSLTTGLQRAHERGARFLVRTSADHVLIEGGRAVGVEARTADGHRVTVRAVIVAVAAGAIGSPALLLRSGLGPPVGEGLRLHPATGVWGHFDEEVRPWTGSVQALYSDQFSDLDGGYGVKFETAPMHPSLLTLGAPWAGSDGFHRLMQALPHTSLVGILLRDRSAGSIRVNRAGKPEIHYRLSRYDRRHVRIGVGAAAHVLRAAGARRIFTTQNRPVVWEGGGEPIDAWLQRVDRVGYGNTRTGYFTFHQMGTCRMGNNPATSVVDDNGETHHVRNLFVADGSLFPTASGVNPMVSIAALAHHVSSRIRSRLPH